MLSSLSCFRLIISITLLMPAFAYSQQLTELSSGIGPALEEVVLVVGDRFLTISDVELEARLLMAMAARAERISSGISREETAAVMEHIINQLLIFQEVERLKVFDVEPDEVLREYESLISAFEDEDSFESFREHLDVGPQRIVSILERNLRVRRYLESRVRLRVRVSDEDLLEFFNKNTGLFAGRELEEVSDAIFVHLFRERFEASIRSLVKDLRERTDVRIISEPRAFAAL